MHGRRMDYSPGKQECSGYLLGPLFGDAPKLKDWDVFLSAQLRRRARKRASGRQGVSHGASEHGAALEDIVWEVLLGRIGSEGSMEF